MSLENKSRRNFKMIENPDLFIAGLTSSGKTTVSLHISDYYNYRQLRNAGTIKQIICEKYGWSPEELEEQKRADSKIRDEHHTQSTYLGKNSTLNRCKLLATRKAFEFENCPDPEKQLLITDVRDHEESAIYLEHGFYGIFLSRTTGDYNAKHWTDANMFMNGKIIELSNTSDFAERMVIVMNGGTVSQDFWVNINPKVKRISLPKNPDAGMLIEALDEYLSELIEPIEPIEPDTQN